MNESKTELAQNIVRQQIANNRYFRFCTFSAFFLSEAIIADTVCIYLFVFLSA